MHVTLSTAEKVALIMQADNYDPLHIKETTGVGMSRIDRISSRARRQINRGLITNMLLDAYEEADTSNEMIKAATELGKLHGLYAPEKAVTITGTFDDASKQIAAMSSSDLQRLLADVEDAETTEVEFLPHE